MKILINLLSSYIYYLFTYSGIFISREETSLAGGRRRQRRMKQGAMAVVVTWREMAVTEEAMGQWRWASEKCREGTVVMMKYEASNKKAAMMMKKVMGGGR